MKKNNYELTYVIADISPEEAKKIHEEVKAVLTKREAEITNVEEWGLRKLFHKTRNKERGYFYWLVFKVNPALVSTINADLRVIPEVIKFMICRT